MSERERVSWLRRAWWRVRLWCKDFWCYSGFGSSLIEYCEVCGIRQPLYWWSANGLWTEVTGHATPEGDNAPGIYCPECFDRRAAGKRMLLRWEPRWEVDPNTLDTDEWHTWNNSQGSGTPAAPEGRTDE